MKKIEFHLTGKWKAILKSALIHLAIGPVIGFIISRLLLAIMMGGNAALVLNELAIGVAVAYAAGGLTAVPYGMAIGYLIYRKQNVSVLETILAATLAPVPLLLLAAAAIDVHPDFELPEETMLLIAGLSLLTYSLATALIMKMMLRFTWHQKNSLQSHEAV